MQGCYELAFTGCGLCPVSEDDDGGKQTKVYNFQIVENDTEISNSSGSSSDEEENDLEDAWKKPLVPAQLAPGIPTCLHRRMGYVSQGFQILETEYVVFMKQIGYDLSESRSHPQSVKML